MVRLRKKWRALREFRNLSAGWFLTRVLVFAAAVPILMRLRLPALHGLLERRIASVAGVDRDRVPPAVILRYVESALTLGAPLVRSTCLTRGLTLYYFLRRAGVDVTLRFGARRAKEGLTQAPGHCWLEKDGEPMFENSDPLQYVVPIYSLPASPSPRSETA